MAEGDRAQEPEFDAEWKVGDPIEEAVVAAAEEPLVESAVESDGPAVSFETTEPPHVESPAPEAGPQEQPLVTEAAFLVYLDGNGHWCGDADLVNRPVIVKRQATFNDYRHACADMAQDLLVADAAGRAAQATIQLQQQVMAQVLQQQAVAKMGEAIGIPGGGVDLAELQRRAKGRGIQNPQVKH